MKAWILCSLLITSSAQANEVFYWDPELGGGYVTYDEAINRDSLSNYRQDMERQLEDQDRRLRELESQQNDNDVNHYRYLLQPK